MDNFKEIKVFVIEDDFVFVELLTNLLDSINDEINKCNLKIVYHTYYSAKEAEYELSLQPDIILLDYFIMDDELNVETGIKLLNGIRKQDSQVDIIVVSGQDSEAVKKELLDSGATAYISKDEKSMSTLKPALIDIISKRYSNEEGCL